MWIAVSAIGFSKYVNYFECSNNSIRLQNENKYQKKNSIGNVIFVVVVAKWRMCYLRVSQKHFNENLINERIKVRRSLI